MKNGTILRLPTPSRLTRGTCSSIRDERSPSIRVSICLSIWSSDELSRDSRLALFKNSRKLLASEVLTRLGSGAPIDRSFAFASANISSTVNAARPVSIPNSIVPRRASVNVVRRSEALAMDGRLRGLDVSTTVPLTLRSATITSSSLPSKSSAPPLKQQSRMTILFRALQPGMRSLIWRQ